MDPMFLACSFFRRKKFQECVNLCNQLLEKNSYDQVRSFSNFTSPTGTVPSHGTAHAETEFLRPALPAQLPSRPGPVASLTLASSVIRLRASRPISRPSVVTIPDFAGFLKMNLKIKSSAVKSHAYIYKAFVRPKLEYASAVWDPHTRTQINQIEKVQRRAARYVTNRYHNTSSVTDIEQSGQPGICA